MSDPIFIDFLQGRQPQTLTTISAKLRSLADQILCPHCAASVRLAATVLDRRAAMVGDRVCRNCGCGEFDPCLSDAGDACGWAEPDLCTACVPGEAA